MPRQQQQAGPMYISAELDNGAVVIGEFQQRQAMRKFAREVMSGVKPFPVWRLVGNTHPHSGEAVTVRTREFLSGSKIVSMQEVAPTVQTHNYEPTNFAPVEEVKSLGYGFWVCPADDAAVEGAVVGARYPVKRDMSDQRRYVTLRVAEGDAPERRHYLDAERAGYTTSSRDWDDEDDGDIEWDGDDD